MNGRELKRMGIFLGLACAGGAWADPDPVQEFITDTSAYVTLTASDPSVENNSFAAAGRWSDGAAPGGDRDYLVQGNRILRAGPAGATFAGRSLTLDNGRIKMGNASDTTTTFPDLRIYGGRIENATGSTKAIAGTVTVLGTADAPARISGCSGRGLNVDAQLKGSAESVVKVMMTEEDVWSQNSNLFRCWLNNGNSQSTYRGRFVVAAGVGTDYGHNVALCARRLGALGAGDPDAATPVLTLKDRACFVGSGGLSFTNPSYSIALENAGTLIGEGADTSATSVTFGGGVRIAGTAPGATLYVRGDAPVAFGNVALENVAGLVVERGAVSFGAAYENADVPVSVAPGAEIRGDTAAAGALTLQSAGTAGGARFAPGAAVGQVGTLACASAHIKGCVTGVLDVAYADGVLSADRLALSGNLVKDADAGGKIVFRISSLPETSDWHGSVRLLSAANLGEDGSLGVDDFEITGLPAGWTDLRPAGTLSIEEADGLKHLVWTVPDFDVPAVRIMPLGDSITYGSQSALAGYREPLYQLLKDAGYNPDFVGTLQTSEGTPVADADHEGHRGWVIARDGNPGRDGAGANGYDGLYENVETWLGTLEEAGQTPHIILLHIGTNDLEGDDFAHAKDRLALLVDRLSTLRPAAWVVVTTLLPRTDNADYNAAIEEQFNPYVEEIVQRRRALGRRVAFLDLHAAVSADQLADGVHPNDDGYAALAQAWFGAVQAIMPGPKALPTSTTQDEIVTLTGVNAVTTSSWDAPLQWDSGRAPAAGKFYYVPAGTLLRTPDNRTPAAFAGESLVLNGGNVNLKHANGSTATANWVVFNSRIAHGCGVAEKIWALGIGGTMDVWGTAAAPATFTGSGAGGTRLLVVSAALRGAADACVSMARTPGEADTSGKGFQCTFTGGNAAYRGRFVASTGVAAGTAPTWTWKLGFGSSAALGAPLADGAKVTLGDGMTLAGAGLAFTNGYALALEGDAKLAPSGTADITGRGLGEGFYFGQGGAVTGSGTSVFRVQGGSALALDDVAFTGVAKVMAEGNANLRVYGGYRQPELPVELYAASLTGDADGVGPVTLQASGCLQPGFDLDKNAVGTLGMASLTVEEGGFLSLSFVKRNDGTATNDLVRVTGSLVKQTAGAIPIRFDRYVNDMPAGTRLALLSAANLGTDLTAADFEASWSNAFLATVVEGHFEVADATLFFVQESGPVVNLLGVDAGGDDSWARARNWSDKTAPHADSHYLVPSGTLLRRSTFSDADAFAGKSLSIDAGGDVAINGLTARVDDLRLFSGGILSTRSNGDANRLAGTATVYAAKGNPFSFEIEAPGATRTLNLEAALKGAGDIRFRYYKTADATAQTPTTFYLVTGDNTAFTGGVELYQRAVCVDFKDERAMGGPAAAFRADRLLFTSNATLRCSASYVMRDPTRGITFGAGDIDPKLGALDGGSILVEEGQALVVSNLISGATSLRKKGTGTLALCCQTNAFSGVVRNQGGVLAVGAAGAVARAQLQPYKSNGGIWRIDAPEGMTVRALDAVIADGSGYRVLDVLPGTLPADGSDGKVSVNLVRFLGATAADAETALARVQLVPHAFGKGWKVEVEAVAVEGGLLVVAHAQRSGTVLILR